MRLIGLNQNCSAALQSVTWEVALAALHSSLGEGACIQVEKAVEGRHYFIPLKKERRAIG
jgi:hypothetical protein